MVRHEVSEIVGQALPILVICGLIEFGSGSVLGGAENSLSLPGILIMVPPLLGLRGNIGGALASRLGTGLHQGIIDPDVLWGPEVKNNVGASVFLTLMISIVIGVLAFTVTVLTGLHAFSLSLLLNLTSIAVIASLISNAGLILLTVLIALFSYRRGWDPDNVTSPLIASLGDLFTVISVYIGVILVV